MLMDEGFRHTFRRLDTNASGNVDIAELVSFLGLVLGCEVNEIPTEWQPILWGEPMSEAQNLSRAAMACLRRS